MELAVGVVGFVFFVLGAVLQLLLLAIIISAVLSWLFAFDVINHRNRFVNQVAGFLDSVVGPVLAPFRRFIPPLGGIDVSPIVAILVIRGIQLFLLPASHTAILQILMGG
ncbi:MAG: YggT family protein [Brevundimonas sp.]|uniref:YggT family protein n=1 Tax=Brevundimonas sp. TaxID=1871086 RepID=UPI00271A3A91|nr:YggT family protein [Brevundimonas sp.]MDO9589245.1 YggT family protein [Brevundimonas sp.]MDP3368581.1 YggT family protein [Brevundimonas sp.]MDP3655449.1 YggT family protein [Brevundimonas sp.]MDZ4112028.1 YggT family protein [Brevundimonas sp.]